MEFHCSDCGKCCLEGAGRLPVTEADIRRWEKDAPHILEHMNVRGEPGKRQGAFQDTNSARCPWIDKRSNKNEYYCRIYDVRPDVCRNYPTSSDHADFTGCPGTFL